MDREQEKDKERKRLEEEAQDDLELADETAEQVQGGSQSDAQKSIAQNPIE
jgi:hypothetical protein